MGQLMIERYTLDRDGVWISKTTGKPMETPDGLFVPMVRSDTPAYFSPITNKPVDGRRARRDDLARSGCREVDPGEWKPTYNDKKNAERAKGEWEPRQAVDLGNGYRRGGVS